VADNVCTTARAVRLLQATGVLQVRVCEPTFWVTAGNYGRHRRLPGVENPPAAAVLPVPRMQGRRARHFVLGSC
jgi:hypothetical protein